MNKKIKNIHPGDVLKEEFLIPMNISVYKLAKETGLSQTRLWQIIRAERSVAAETALKLGKFFSIEPEFWLNLQNYFDLEKSRKNFAKDLKSIQSIQELGLIQA